MTITITASNAGPETAPDTKVAVDLPEGLTYSSHVPAADDFTKSHGIRTWDAGSLASGASKTLTITASVDSGTRGETLTTKATISATETLEITETVDGMETVEEYDVPVADPDPNNDMDTGTATVEGSPNVDPMFRIERTVGENAAANANVGGPALVRAGDSDQLTYTIVGTDADNFQVDSSGQVSVAEGAVLNYECQTSFPLTLQVSDGKDADGNADSAIDHVIGMDILVTDDTAETDTNVTVSVKASNDDPLVGETVTLTAEFLNYSSCAPSDTRLNWLESISGQDGGTGQVVGRNVNKISITKHAEGTHRYNLNGTFDGGSHSVNLHFSVTWRSAG